MDSTSRPVTTNFRHAVSGKVVTFNWQAPRGMTASDATEALAKAGIRAKLAAHMGVSEAEIDFSVTRGTGLAEGVLKLASDKKSGSPKASGGSAKAPKAVDPEARAQALALEYVVAHPQTTFAKALSLAKVQVAREAVEAQVATYDTELASLKARMAELEALKAQAVASLKAAKAAK